MKEATGELSMTVVTIIAIVAIAGIVTVLVPLVRKYINSSWDNLSNTKPKVTYVEVVDTEINM